MPTLFGSVFDEAAATTGNSFNMMNAYLNSRRKVDQDDLPAGFGAADHSILRSMFNVEDATDDELQVIADDNQDLPPYDADAAAGSYTSICIADVAACGNWGAPKDVVHFDAPFGLTYLEFVKTTDSAGALQNDVTFLIEVLGISEMQA